MSDTASNSAQRRNPRSRASTVSAYRNQDDESLAVPIRSRVASAQASTHNSPTRQRSIQDLYSSGRPTIGSRTNSSSLEPAPRSHSIRDPSPAGSLPRLSRVPTDSSIRSHSLRPIRTRDSVTDEGNVFGDHAASPTRGEYAEHYYARSGQPSPAPSEGSRRMAPPPPPPSRSKKPPPPPPLKRSALSTSDVPLY